jgi:methionyl-tRNA formyltransferase
MNSESSQRQVFLIGNGPTAAAALSSLLQEFQVCGIARDLSSSAEDSVRSIAKGKDIPVFPLQSPKEIAAQIAELHPDCVVISSFNRILPASILSLCNFVNVHFSPLPRYRGRANVNWALINGEATAAISIHTVVPGLDSGNILYQEEIPIEPRDTANSLYERLNSIQEQELGRAVLRLLNGDKGRPQNHSDATYGCARIPTDGEIDWSDSTATIDRLIRALAPPSPGAYTWFEGQQLIISSAIPIPDPPCYQGRIPGRVVGRSPSEGWVDVLTGDTILRLWEVIPSSGNPGVPATIIKSTRDTLGLSKHFLLQQIRSLEKRLAQLENQIEVQKG